jgi:hypothetical protein
VHADPKELKKQVSRTLTNVLKASALRDRIDPKAFFLMINSNFALLYQGNRLDLGPIHDALAPQHSDIRLEGFFAELAEAATNLGIEVGLPRAMQGMTTEEIQLAQADFQMSIDGDLSRAEISASGLTPLPSLLADDAIKPLISDDLRRQVIQATVQAIKTAPVGQKVDGAQLAYLIDNNFDQLCDGETFDFQPILDGLRELGTIDDTEIYVAVVKLRSSLQELKLNLSGVKLAVDDTLGARLVADAKRHELRTADIAATVAATKTSSIDLPQPQEKRAENKEQELKRLGLGRENARRAKIIRMSALVMAMIMLGTFAFISRPNRGLDAAHYKGLPMKSAELVEGNFVGVLDDTGWYKLDLKKRETHLREFEAEMRAAGLIQDLQVRDPKGRLCVTSNGPNDLMGASFFMFGDESGQIDPATYKRPKNAPTVPEKKK